MENKLTLLEIALKDKSLTVKSTKLVLYTLFFSYVLSRLLKAGIGLGLILDSFLFQHLLSPSPSSGMHRIQGRSSLLLVIVRSKTAARSV